MFSFDRLDSTSPFTFKILPAKKIEVNGFDLIRFVNGKAVEHWGLTDSMTMMMQFGAMPMPEQEHPKQ